MTQCDTGAANERTALAWERTALAHAAVAVAMLLSAFDSGRPALGLIALPPLAGLVGATIHGRKLYGHRRVPSVDVESRWVTALALCVTASAAAGFAVVATA